MESMLIVRTDTVQASNDKQQVQPMLKQLMALQNELGAPVVLVADAGYFSAANVNACVDHPVNPLIAVNREGHHPDPTTHFTEPSPLAESATPVEIMRHVLKTSTGRAIYAKRKCIVEPVIGIVKLVLGFRQFLLRGLENVKGELNLVAMGWNIKRMFILKGA